MGIVKKIRSRIKRHNISTKIKKFTDNNKFLVSLILILLCAIVGYFIVNQVETIIQKRKNKDIIDEPEVPAEKVYEVYDGIFELPINGATGYASIDINLYNNADYNSGVILRLSAGSGFTIIEEVGDWWKIEYGTTTGYLPHRNCFINLPDVIPSIIYNITNSSFSVFRSSMVDIPNVTGQKLYDSYFYNERLGETEYAVPILYSSAKKLAQVQKEALSNGETLIVYEAFRPWEAQNRVATNTINLIYSNSYVNAGINAYPWYIDWFIATSVSNHQQGYAIDTSLGKVVNFEERTTGDYKYTVVTDYEEYQMPTRMHEISVAAVKFILPVSPSSKDAWRYVDFSSTMTEKAIQMNTYYTNHGFTPLASEWWHFNDLDSAYGNNGNGNYLITNVYSKEPKKSN